MCSEAGLWMNAKLDEQGKQQRGCPRFVLCANVIESPSNRLLVSHL
jgi:hypothetical protein